MKKYLKDTSNLISFSLALVPAILLYIFQPSSHIPYAVFVILLLVALTFAWLSIKLYLDLCDQSALKIEIISCTKGRCICKPSGLITYNSIVSFHQAYGDYERYIGYGVVETITQKGYAQILPTPISNTEFVNFAEYINDNKSLIIVRPTITKDTLDLFQNNQEEYYE